MNQNQFIELVKKGYSLDHVYVLEFINKSGDVYELFNASARFLILKQSMIRKGLITDEFKLTTLGKEVLKLSQDATKLKIVKKTSDLKEFDSWWSIFPGTDTFTYKNKTFSGSRSLRINKPNCRIKFDQILFEGTYTAKQIIDATLLDVNQKKEASYVNKTNKLSFLQNSLTYLNQRSFEPFIELLNDVKITQNKSERIGGTEI